MMKGFNKDTVSLTHARFHPQDPSPGPIENVLTGYEVQGLAIGAYGEASPEVHDMLQRISEAASIRSPLLE